MSCVQSERREAVEAAKWHLHDIQGAFTRRELAEAAGIFDGDICDLIRNMVTAGSLIRAGTRKTGPHAMTATYAPAGIPTFDPMPLEQALRAWR